MSPRELPIYQVDAFTSQVFSGNPAAVVPLKQWLPDEILLKIAAENNLSETAFFVAEDDKFHLRWFTPTVEVDLCGHATLATSWVIFNELNYSKDKIIFKSLSGDLTVTKSANGLTLNFPVWKTTLSDKPEPVILKGLGKQADELYKGKKWVAVFNDEEFIASVNPDIDVINTIDTQGLIITADSKKSSLDFVSRYFGPQLGIDEDPVTGSAHCILTPIWAEKLGKTSFNAQQVSARGGDLHCELKGDRVLISGNATLYMKGVIFV